LVHFFKPGGAKGNRRKDNPGKQFLQLIALYILKTKSGIEKAKRNYLEASIINSLSQFFVMPKLFRQKQWKCENSQNFFPYS